MNARFFHSSIEYPEVGLRAILPRLKEAFAPYTKEHTQDTRNAHSFAAEDRRLANVLPSEKDEQRQIQLGAAQDDAQKRETEREAITHAYLWPRLSSFFKEGDVIVGETGTSSFGILDTTLPKNVTLVLQGSSYPPYTHAVDMADAGFHQSCGVRLAGVWVRPLGLHLLPANKVVAPAYS